MSRTRITAKAKAIFREMQAAETNAAWWEAHSRLHDELGLSPWIWPCVIGPDEKTPSMPGTFAAQCHAEARALCGALGRR